MGSDNKRFGSLTKTTTKCSRRRSEAKNWAGGSKSNAMLRRRINKTRLELRRVNLIYRASLKHPIITPVGSECEVTSHFTTCFRRIIWNRPPKRRLKAKHRNEKQQKHTHTTHSKNEKQKLRCKKTTTNGKKNDINRLVVRSIGLPLFSRILCSLNGVSQEISNLTVFRRDLSPLLLTWPCAMRTFSHSASVDAFKKICPMIG